MVIWGTTVASAHVLTVHTVAVHWPPLIRWVLKWGARDSPTTADFFVPESLFCTFY